MTKAKPDGKRVYFTIGRSPTSGVFETRKGPGAGTRVMDRNVFKSAVKNADGKFREVVQNSSDGTVVIIGGDGPTRSKIDIEGNKIRITMEKAAAKTGITRKIKSPGGQDEWLKKKIAKGTTIKSSKDSSSMKKTTRS